MHPYQGAPIVHHHDCIIPREGHHVALVWDLIEFHASGDGCRDHEIIHHVVVPDLVLDGVCMVWASLLEEPLKVVCGRPRLALATADGDRDTCHIEATRFLIIATIIVGHG
jgi:hypothetical protein